ncbi:MAG: histidine phosphatase family protein [Caldimicrobium sp.]
MKNIFLIRHGPVAKEYKEVFYGQLDVPLSPEGEELSQRFVKEFSSLEINAIFSSPAQRALYPAQLLAKEKKLPLIVKEELKEINYGAWTGRLRVEVMREPLYWERLKKDYLAPPGGESIRALRERAKTFLEALKQEPSGNFAIFTHGGFIRAFLCEILNLNSDFFFAFDIYHLKIQFITLFEDNLLVVKGLNCQASQVKSLLDTSYW